MVAVSIIVPNYNHAAFLHERLDSIFQQSFQDFELILLDDASSDDSVGLLSAYKNHPKVRCLEVNSKNSGSVFQQWVKGIKLAQGQYIWIAESDDFAHPEFLERTVAVLDRNPSIGFVFTDSEIVDASGMRQGLASEKSNMISRFKKLDREVVKHTDIPNYFINDLLVYNVSSTLFRADALRHIDMDFLKQFYNAGDLYTYIAILLKTDIFYLNEPLNYFRVHSENTTKSNIQNGQLHRDRLLIMAYFTPLLYTIAGCKHSLSLFIKRHFLVSSDFGFISELQALLKVYRKFEVLPLLTYWHLRCFCFLKKKVPGYKPYFYRQFIKRQLGQLIKHTYEVDG
ncbi:glycosyltransferase [Aestuariivivens insulae]|uniref:glycosyltransferase n=1 Tax=Aestuariivivens insulae TaxID=1621988 RepID=UPI001F5658C4|nr:glycosyltransferase [Aestuariivivens insulae]